MPSAVTCDGAAAAGPSEAAGAPLSWWACGGAAENASLVCPRGALMVACAEQAVGAKLQVEVAF